ncbi:hypothetical protein GF354_01510 [Candidatus Peregrinibacteria bacterium]|nr:hypothetical protein [Candidatus Peregrinibacteria bacterium]
MKDNRNKDLNDERYHMENLVNSRFHFLLLLFTAIIASIGLPLNYITSGLIFIVGAIICFVVSITISRAHKKMAKLMDLTLEIKDHPASIVDEIVKSSDCFLTKHSAKNFIGYYIPWSLTILLLIVTLIIFIKQDNELFSKKGDENDVIILINQKNKEQKLDEILINLKYLDGLIYKSK